MQLPLPWINLSISVERIYVWDTTDEVDYW